MTFTSAILIPIIASIIGAFFGFIWQIKNDKNKDKRGILQTLMAYRGVGAMEHDWVKALNMIDIVFYGNPKIKVLRKEYFKHLCEPLYDTGLHDVILTDLLSEMAKDIGYSDLKPTDIEDYYCPRTLYTMYGVKPDISEQKGNSLS
ncbi:MAG: hypothetical protein IPJ81_19030 [Chitinophagaceae bacterium]|nr:hypothetical protein [Chitinophagaceae bacterium]